VVLTRFQEIERMIRTEQRLPTELFAVVFGDDHHSFPTAINNTLKLQIRDVFHYTYGHLNQNSDVFSAKITLRHIDLDFLDQPLALNEWEWSAKLATEGICHDLSLPFHFGQVVFFGLPELALFEKRSHDHTHLFLKVMMSVENNRLGNQIGFLPNGKADWISMLRRNFGIHRQEFDGLVPPVMRSAPGTVYLASPGHCRAHTFCICDLHQGEVTWQYCS
jgi:hypothetical protein